MALYDASVLCLNELKASGEKITPKQWQAEMERLSTYNDTLYQQMKSMRTEIQAVEKIRKTADELAQSEKSRDRGQEYDR